jgi:hypothetical protein
MTGGLGFAALAVATGAKMKPREETALGPRANAVAGTRSGAFGTARLASPVDATAVEVLKARRDKVAAKERLAKLSNCGRHVALHGLHRLPRGFETRTLVPAQVVQAQSESEEGALASKGASFVQAPACRPMVQTRGSTQKGSVGPGMEAFACNGGPLRGSV